MWPTSGVADVRFTRDARSLRRVRGSLVASIRAMQEEAAALIAGLVFAK
jgi:hypothetical protein